MIPMFSGKLKSQNLTAKACLLHVYNKTVLKIKLAAVTYAFSAQLENGVSTNSFIFLAQKKIGCNRILIDKIASKIKSNWWFHVTQVSLIINQVKNKIAYHSNIVEE